ncbi:ThuA domain-containing protein [Rufibacter sediminis]|uniref:ThuA domain-containing protein n=1 Tax=Rufibacter sediminis TaxID=2762756 RepID=A0ABR6VYK7_9BACT|nr:ThuA domain-containing protein [Rufibacter sediminis]MBC3542251.1 ThuA domain-containing protein [Rufibacter sediminis]
MKPLYFLLIACVCLFANCSPENGKRASASSPAVLVFYKTAGFYHKSIPAGLTAIQKLGKENGFQVDTTNNAAFFVPDSLRHYKAVLFLSTTQDVLTDAQQGAFEQFIKAGGGFVGVHAATDTEYNWPWYNQLVGAYFVSHPEVQNATVQVVDKKHISTSFLPDRWERKDEWYNFKNINPNIKVLATLDESTYKGGKNGATHPIAWYHTFDGGKAFYTAGGHTDESFQEPLFLRHLLGGIQYVLQD